MTLPFSDWLPVGVCSFASLSNSLLKCAAERRIPEKASSVIVYLFPYGLGEEAYRGSNVSRYAVSADYHRIVSSYLQRAAALLVSENPGFRFESFCDNSPFCEVKAAVNAGLGVLGKNGLLIHPSFGSYCFIGEIATDLELAPGFPAEEGCKGCGKCLSVCPTGALTENGVCKEKCLSDITQRKGELTQKQKELIRKSGCVWGCDLCQTVCPMNKNAAVTPIPAFLNTARPVLKPGDPIEGRAYEWRGKKTIERNLMLFGCNDDENRL